jgi:ABC-type oligopeptide transport system substrate-binding subunit
VFHLQAGAQWSDGTPVTAHDVEFAWKRALNPSAGARYASLLHDLRGAEAYHRGDVSDPDTVGVRAVDDSTLVAELTNPTGFFLQMLTHEVTYPVPRHAVVGHGESWSHPDTIVSYGPFALEELRPDDSIVLARSADYGGVCRGNVERVELALLDSPTWRERLALYEADQLDALIVSGFPPTVLDRLRQRHPDQFISVPLPGTRYVGFNVRRRPLDDKRVRRALTLATDRETISGVILGGHALPALGGLVPPGMPGHSPGIGLPHNVEEAKRLLVEAGYPGGRGFPVLRGMMPSPSGQWVDLADYLAAQWRQGTGVEVRWEYVPAEEYFPRLREEHHHLHLLGWTADYHDPDNFLRVGFGHTKTAWRDEEYDRLVGEARRLLDQEARMALYRRADQIVTREAAFLPLAYMQWQVLVKPWVKGLTSWGEHWSPWEDVIIEPH